jgi:hypothetical protein
MRKLLLLMLPVPILLCGCNALRTGLANTSAVPASPSPIPVAAAVQDKLMLFGGEGHKTYLGCLDCSEYASDSVKNQYGTHGSPYSSESIFNHYGQFGSPYSSYSACNQYATDPPVIVDGNGRYYGRLTLNTLRPDIGEGNQLLGWLKAICQG